MEVFWKVFYLIIILPILIFGTAYEMFKDFMNKGNNRWEKLPYVILAILSIVFVLFWLQGLRF